MTDWVSIQFPRPLFKWDRKQVVENAQWLDLRDLEPACILEKNLPLKLTFRKRNEAITWRQLRSNRVSSSGTMRPYKIQRSDSLRLTTVQWKETLCECITRN